LRIDKDIYISLGLGSLIQNMESELKIQKLEAGNDSAYLINDKFGVLYKYSTLSSSPWSFIFNLSDKIVLNDFELKYDEYAAAFVCGPNCVGVIVKSELKTLIDVNNIENSRVTLKTFERGSLSVSGSLGKLKRKISKSQPWNRIQNKLIV